jgi:hypothetical protein
MQGMMVEHQRFGIGKVIKIEGVSPNKKASVFFQNAGQKQLLLKFAKLKIKGKIETTIYQKLRIAKKSLVLHVENRKTLSFPENKLVVNNSYNTWTTIRKEKNFRCPSTAEIFRTW